MTHSLIADATQIEFIHTVRVLVSSALLYTITIHYLFMGSVYLFARDDIKIERIYDHGRRLVFYGIAALLSFNFINYGVYHAILAWLTLICVLIIHSMALIRDIPQNYQNIGIAVYYFLIFTWFVGIVAFYFYYDDNT